MGLGNLTSYLYSRDPTSLNSLAPHTLTLPHLPTHLPTYLPIYLPTYHFRLKGYINSCFSAFGVCRAVDRVCARRVREVIDYRVIYRVIELEISQYLTA